MKMAFKNLWESINRQQRNRSFASTAGPSHALPSKSWMKRANLAPVYIVMGMVTVAATIGAHTAKQQLFHSPSVSVNKKKRETIPEVDTPTRVVNSADKFISKSFLRKVANIQDESRQTMPNPIRGDILASPRRAETLESSGA